MTLLQAVFSLHSIMCFFYGCATFFHPEVTVELGLARKFIVPRPPRRQT